MRFLRFCGGGILGKGAIDAFCIVALGTTPLCDRVTSARRCGAGALFLAVAPDVAKGVDSEP